MIFEDDDVMRWRRSSWAGPLLRGWTPYDGGGGKLGELLVDRYPVVVERGRLQDYTRRSHQDGERENPEEQPV